MRCGYALCVVVRVLAHLRDESPQWGRAKTPRKLTIVCVHIDYGNRAESGAEAAFCQQWCESYGIELRTRRIDEVARGKTKRDEYEQITRDIRYGWWIRLVVICSHDQPHG